MNQFRVFKQVPRLLFGERSLERLSELLPAKEGDRHYYLFVIDDVHRSSALHSRIAISPHDRVIWFPATEGEPSTSQVDALRDSVLGESGCLPTAVVGVGGGSTMDVAKALAVMLKNKGSSAQYQGWDLLPNPGVYKVGVPTVAGSGAEASRTAVLMGEERKFGINSDFSMFDAIILDSSLIATVPREQRFYSGMDCYIHCVESLQGTMINELSRGYANKALELCERVFLGDGDNDMLVTASYFGGVSIVNSEVGVCHALSYGLSMELHYRHGFANCVVFNVLDEYYGDAVKHFRKMLVRHAIELPRNVCGPLGEAAIERMVNMTLRMERPLANALGPDWQRLFTHDRIRDLYSRM